MSGPMRLGLLRLCDAAPLILAEKQGVFGRHGVEVSLSVEPSWANIADKLGYGLLDGAVMLPPLAIACAAGLRGIVTPLMIPLGLSANGNAIAIATPLAAYFENSGQAPRATAQAVAGTAAKLGRKLRLALVHAYSTHHLLLRDWLATNGLDPDRVVEVSVLPPADMVGALAAGVIDGFCAGAPWADVAAHAEVGFVALRSAAIWHDHPEKCLALRGAFVENGPDRIVALTRALREAGRACADATLRPTLAALLAAPEYLDLPAPVIASSLDPAAGGPLFGDAVGYPSPDHGAWFAGQMLRWGAAGALEDVAASLYRPDIYLAAGG